MDKNIDKARKLKKRKLHIRKSISGTASRPRMTVFRSNHHMYIQVIDDVAEKTLISANTVEADLANLKNTVADATKLGEVIGDGTACDAAADYDDAGFFWECVVTHIQSC